MTIFSCSKLASAQRYQEFPDFGPGPVYLKPEDANIMVAFRNLARGKAVIEVMDRYDLLFEAQLNPPLLQQMLRYLNSHHQVSKHLLSTDQTFSFLLERTSAKTVRLTIKQNLIRSKVVLDFNAKATDTLFSVLRFVRM